MNDENILLGDAFRSKLEASKVTIAELIEALRRYGYYIYYST